MKKIVLILILLMLGSSMLIERTVCGERYDDPRHEPTKPPFLPFSKFHNDTITYLSMNLEQWRYSYGKREGRFIFFFDDFYRKDPKIKSVYIRQIMGQENAINGKVVSMFFFFYTPQEIAYKINNNKPICGIRCLLRAVYSDNNNNNNTAKYRELQKLGLEQVIPITPEIVRIIEDVELWSAWFEKDLTNLFKKNK